MLDCYKEVGLPGAVGSVDVVHIKWSNCPAGHMNRSKGKEGYPTLAFKCISLVYLGHTLARKMISILLKWIQMLQQFMQIGTLDSDGTITMSTV
jgi:hypothetical protein